MTTPLDLDRKETRANRLGRARNALASLLRLRHRDAPTLQSALFRIAQLSRDSADLNQFYAAIHRIVGELMEARNFYIAEYDARSGLMTFPYFVDELDPAPPPEGLRLGRGLTGYVIRTGEPLLATPDVFQALHSRGEVESIGAPSVDWLGVPLKTGDRTWGVLGVQSYDYSTRYTEHEKDILVFVSGHVAAAIEQKRSEDALRASERRYRQMFENNRAVKLLIDPDSGSIVDGNLSATEFYGYTSEELRSLRIWDINTLTEEEVRREMESARGERRSYFNFRHRLKNGEIRDVEVHSGPIESGGRTILYSIVHDITERKRAEEGLQRSEEKFRNIFDFAPVGIYQSLPDGRILTVNPILASMLGYSSVEELLRVRITDVYCDPLDREELIRCIGPLGYATDYEVRWRKKDGTPIWIRLTAHSRRFADGTTYYEGFVHDITRSKEADSVVRQQSAAMMASMDGIGILDESLTFVYANGALAKLYDVVYPFALSGQSLMTILDPDDGEQIMNRAIEEVRRRGRWRGEARGRRRDGTTFPQEISLAAIEGGGMVYIVRDVTERTFAEEQIKHLAYHDVLTGLPNRLLFKDRLTVALSHAQRTQSKVAILFLDLDRFKVINDSLGHNVGDQLLQAVAGRVQRCIRESDTVARLGGDEFTILLPFLTRSDDAGPVAQKILEAIRLPFHIEEREFLISTSIGISVFPEDGVHAEALIKNADTAMYQAKEQGRDNYQMFNASVNAKVLQRITIEQGLKRALANGEMSLHYQPIFDVRSRSFSGMEALLRWNHPEMGPIPPATFIPIAESTGAMSSIGSWVLHEACRNARLWCNDGRNLGLSVNLSVTQLQHAGLVSDVEEALRASGLMPGLLQLEITESMAMQNPEASIRMLDDLRRLGIRTALDDFGTGHSSLSYLKRFPIDALKIDQSFVRDVTLDADSAAIVTAIIAMAHSLRLNVVAEGVESHEQAAFLERYGCDQLQGFLLQHPVPAEELGELLGG